LAAVRGTTERLKFLHDAFYGKLKDERRVAEDWELEDYNRQVKELRKERGTAWVFGGLGMLLSAGIGDVFWHNLFEGLGPWGWVLSTSCAAVISLTFVHSELYLALMNGVLREILADVFLMKVAVSTEGQQMQLEMAVDAYEAVRQNEEVRKPAQLKIEKTVARQLTTFADQVEQVGGQVAQFNQQSIAGGAQLQLPPPRGKYHLHRSELLRLLHTNPGLSNRDVQRHFQISLSTANDWLKKARSGQ
jgi:hypothetical protein